MEIKVLWKGQQKSRKEENVFTLGTWVTHWEEGLRVRKYLIVGRIQSPLQGDRQPLGSIRGKALPVTLILEHQFGWE
jgi:hypothetical protein